MNLEIAPIKTTKDLDFENLKNKLNFILDTAVKFLEIKKKNMISLSFISAKDIQSLNNEFRDKDKPTDVLSWSYLDDSLLPHELAGDIYICLEIAKKQAQQKKHSLEYELLFLFSHGLLHVFGYDHQNDDEENEMNSLQQSILKKAGIVRK